LLSASDVAHRWARETFAEFESPLLSCDAVIAEADYLLSHTRTGGDGLMALLESGAIKLISLAELDPALTRRLISRYENVPMDLADACVVRLSEVHPTAKVVTIDRDFLVYRRNGRQIIPLIHPPFA
jgi:uncharacterized protein